MVDIRDDVLIVAASPRRSPREAVVTAWTSGPIAKTAARMWSARSTLNMARRYLVGSSVREAAMPDVDGGQESPWRQWASESSGAVARGVLPRRREAARDALR